MVAGDKGIYCCAGFGAPMSHRDDPARVVRAALEVAQGAPAVGVEGVRVGVTVDRVWAWPFGADARVQDAVLGDGVNTAARLMTRARPGTVWADGSIVDEVEGLRVTGADGGDIDGAVEVVGLDAGASPGVAFTGRRAELRALAGWLDDARAGRGQAVALGVLASHRPVAGYAPPAYTRVPTTWLDLYDETRRPSDLDGARAAVRAYGAFARTFPVGRPTWHLLRGRLALASGKEAAAQRHLSAARDGALTAGMRPEAALALTWLARCRTLAPSTREAHRAQGHAEWGALVGAVDEPVGSQEAV